MPRNSTYRVIAILLLVVAVIGVGLHFLPSSSFPLFDPKGVIAEKERHLILLAITLMSLVVVPVLLLTFWIAWNFRSSNQNATYSPEWDHNVWAEAVWWGIPCLIILILAVITWTSSHQLDPSKALASPKAAITIQVVALKWKWLFIYPKSRIATVNFIQFPVDTPINFQITSDAPMNSFWIPQLGGQMYAMPGMSTNLHLMANQVGSFKGLSANISGAGFAGMKFTAKSTSQADYETWTKQVQGSKTILDTESYVTLSKPSQYVAVQEYSLTDDHLYDEVVSKFMDSTMQTQ